MRFAANLNNTNAIHEAQSCLQSYKFIHESK